MEAMAAVSAASQPDREPAHHPCTALQQASSKTRSGLGIIPLGIALVRKCSLLFVREMQPTKSGSVVGHAPPQRIQLHGSHSLSGKLVGQYSKPTAEHIVNKNDRNKPADARQVYSLA